MNWKATGWALLVIGVGIAIGGFVWAGKLHDEATDCRLDNVFGATRECTATSTPGWILAGVGGGIALLAVALLIGAMTNRQMRN